MTKADLVEKVTQLGDLTRRDGEVIVETIFDSVIAALQSATLLLPPGLSGLRRPHDERDWSPDSIIRDVFEVPEARLPKECGTESAQYLRSRKNP